MSNASSTARGGTDASRKKPAASLSGSALMRSEVLLNGKPQLTILHNEELYFLRRTRLGKLILTK
ncbi:MAG: hemin uptake protein HemP [Burkholderiales bacterium]|nr:hemin uptake protein HemP [Burkholderiales bacterium]